MEYVVLEGSGPEHVAIKASRLAADGWRLMGPVVPVLGVPGRKAETTFIATMERSTEQRDKRTFGALLCDHPDHEEHPCGDDGR